MKKRFLSAALLLSLLLTLVLAPALAADYPLLTQAEAEEKYGVVITAPGHVDLGESYQFEDAYKDVSIPVTIQNTSDTRLEVEGNIDPVPRAYLSTGHVFLQPGESQTFNIVLRSSKPGTYTETVTCYFKYNSKPATWIGDDFIAGGTSGEPFLVEISTVSWTVLDDGELVLDGGLGLSTREADMGTVNTAQGLVPGAVAPEADVFTVTNNTSYEIILGGIELLSSWSQMFPDSDRKYFELYKDNPSRLAPGESCTIHAEVPRGPWLSGPVSNTVRIEYYASEDPDTICYSEPVTVKANILYDGGYAIRHSGGIVEGMVKDTEGTVYGIQKSPAIIPPGGSITYLFSPYDSTQYHVGSVVVDGVDLGPLSSYTFSNVQAPHTISWTFEPGPAPVVETPSSWAQVDVDRAKMENILPSSLQGKYTAPATRAEYCALATALYEKVKGEITQRETFSDTTDPNVEKMAAIGVVGGVGGNRFAPNDKLTREQAATMLARLAEAMGKPFGASAATFADSASVSGWAAAAVGQVQAAGIMNGTGANSFTPLGDYTREQCVISMVRLLDYIR